MQRTKVNWNGQEYVNCRVARGFPMGGMGSGGFSINTDGSFSEFRLNNNWMNPIRKVKGTYFAVKVEEETQVLGSCNTRFRGELPEFELRGEGFTLSGFTPHIPHDEKNSTIPGALFCLKFENEGDVAALFSWENILGLGGSGPLGVKSIGKWPVGLRTKVTYKDREGNRQAVDGNAIRYWTERKVDEKAHRRSTLGEYRIAVDAPDGFEVTACSSYDPQQSTLLDEFARSGRISEQGGGPAGALAVSGKGPGEIWFAVSWWTAEHVTEQILKKNYRSGKHEGVRVGHIYENYFSGAKDVADYLLANRDEFYSKTMELPSLVKSSSLPAWLKNAMLNSIDSTLCNTVIPMEGTMYTIEGLDWQWPIGGLTGTNDQRLSSHPYTSVFFSELDRRELEAFRRNIRPDGSVPHGNGNCDLALDTADIPYGWPMELKGFLHNFHWTDLAASEIIQLAKHFRMSGERAWIMERLPDMQRMADYLDSISVNGVPEGGSTYDVPEWEFEGSFIYSATVYMAALTALIDLAEELEPAIVSKYRERFDRCRQRVDETLWREDLGYYQSTPDNDTVFCGAMAGDWAARYSGLQPLLDPHKVARHMKFSHKMLIGGAKEKASRKKRMPHPWSAARPDGREIVFRNINVRLDMYMSGIDHLIYLWQVPSYQAMQHIYLGQVDLGMDILKRIYDRLYDKGHAWSGHLTGGPESVYMTHPVLWALPDAFTGAALDVSRGILKLAPKLLPNQEECKVPVCFPGFWVMLDYSSDRVSFEVKRCFGEPVQLKKIILNEKQYDVDLRLKRGCSWSA